MVLAFGLALPLACGGRSLKSGDEAQAGNDQGSGGGSVAGSKAIPSSGTSSGGTGVVAMGGKASGGVPSTAGQGGSPAGAGGTPAGAAGVPNTDPGGFGGGGVPGGGDPGLSPLPPFAGGKNEHGFALKDSYFLMPCLEVQQHDCLTVLGECPNQDADYEQSGRVFSEDFELGGCAGKLHAVTIKVNGVAEGKYYEGGMRRNGSDFSDAFDVTGGDGWYVGGSPIPSSYNAYKLTVLEPDGETEVQHYYLNSFPQSSGFESHTTLLLGYEATITVPGQGIVRLSSHDSNCRTINNCGFNETGQCAGPFAVPNEPGLAVPATYGGKPVDMTFNIVNGAQQPFHSQMIHISVVSVVAAE